ncbi:hypothetical protein IFM89_004784 [Coptis chinensis]|uniref:ENTH domain-containing protein n=1 Tax=Coptis chinensis TaxID=261450 RepID=A0A835I8X1_9MAGN|nr:hypothetical protein IFM89_004784 [Coptis chinensis]
MAGTGSTQLNLRKALGALKDSTKVGLAKVNSEYKELDIAIVKATNHVEHIAKEKHISTIFSTISSSRPRADVAYCIYALAKRLSKTHNWAFCFDDTLAYSYLLAQVALKTLIVIHRALREVDPTFREELINYSKNRGHMLNLSRFKDESSPTAWDYSAWVRVYALYLEERLECSRILKYDVEADRLRSRELDTPDLLEQLPALQQLLFRLLACQPEGAAVYNIVILYALQLHDAVRALEIYKKTGNQSERLSEFYETCRSLEFGRKQKFIKIEQPPASFLTTMEEYVKEAPRPLMLTWNGVSDDRGARTSVGTPDSVLSIKPKSEKEVEEDFESSITESEASTTMPSEDPLTPPIIDLLGLDEISQDATELEEKNAHALAIINSEDPLNAINVPVESTGWEVALVTTPSSNSTVVAESKLAGGLDKLTLDSLYEDAMARRTNQNGTYHTGQVAPNPFEITQYMHDPFYASNDVAPPSNVQLADMAQQQQAFMMQQQHQQQQQSVAGQNPTNPFGNPYDGQDVQAGQSQSPYTSFI